MSGLRRSGSKARPRMPLHEMLGLKLHIRAAIVCSSAEAASRGTGERTRVLCSSAALRLTRYPLDVRRMKCDPRERSHCPDRRNGQESG